MLQWELERGLGRLFRPAGSAVAFRAGWFCTMGSRGSSKVKTAVCVSKIQKRIFVKKPSIITEGSLSSVQTHSK
jgi:hypothetical protein